MDTTGSGRHDDPLIGRVLDDRYRVGARIARGGMATVYRATDLRLDRDVAVKVMHAGLTDDPEFVARFGREARSAARLTHHNVVSVFDQGDDAGTLFLVMEYVSGITLRDLIRKDAPMEPGKALALLESLLAALAAAHTAGMIHRDVKPENVLLADDGRVKVADFGLARAINAETQHTATGGVLIGTVSYLAPELVVDGTADPRSDVYAAGVICYEMLTGVKPHQADNPIQVAYKHVHEDVPAPSERVPGLPEYVDALVARATVRDPAMRPSDARVLLHQVRRVRQALDHGVTDDPELAADLWPAPVAADRVPTGELLVPVEPARVTGEQPAIGLIDRDAEATTHIPVASIGPPVAETPPPPRDDLPPPRIAREPGLPRRRSRRGPILLVGVVLLAVLVGLGGWWFGVARYTATPGVINLSAAAAKDKIEAAGLAYAAGKPAYSETVAKGSVIRTDPAAGDRILKDGTVTAVISLGPERHKVPKVRGMTLDEAQDALLAAKLGFGEAKEQFHNKIAEGKVIRTDPKAGTELRRDGAVNVIVSKGREPIKISNFAGKLGSTAKDKLGDAGFKVEVIEQFNDQVPDGRVISQTPNSGTGFKGDTITLVVSKGPQFVAVPNIARGTPEDEAKRLLDAAGLKMEANRVLGGDVVWSISPAAGTVVPTGSSVKVTLVPDVGGS